MTLAKGLAFLAISTLASWGLAVSVRSDGMELGAVYNMFFPPFLGFLSGILYALTCWISRSRLLRTVVMILSCLYILYVGTGLHFTEHFYLPLTIW